MIPMWMCPGCGPFSLRRPACALSFGAATWSHEVSTVVWIRGIPKWTLLLSHPPIFLAQDRWEDRWPNFQVTELLWFISSQFRDMSLSKFQFRAIHQESSWNFLGESLKHIMPWPCLFTFRTSTLCGSSFRHASIMQKKFRIAEGLRCGLGSTPLRSADSEGTCSLNRHECSFALLLIKKTWSKNIIHVSCFFFTIPISW
jgi:hypothetical protein